MDYWCGLCDSALYGMLEPDGDQPVAVQLRSMLSAVGGASQVDSRPMAFSLVKNSTGSGALTWCWTLGMTCGVSPVCQLGDDWLAVM